MDLPGVGPVVAARVLADVGDVARFADRNRFASWTGTAPLDASSGEQNRHRLSRAGNRRMNHMIHIAAVTQLRLDTDGRAYYRRKRAEGKKPLEAMRCLKRRISDAIYRQLRRRRRRRRAERSLTRAREGTAGRLMNPARPTCPRTSTLRISHFPDPHPRRYPRHDPCEPPPGLGSPANAPTRRSRQGAAPHRTNDLDGDKRRRTLQRADPGPLTTEGSRCDAATHAPTTRLVADRAALDADLRDHSRARRPPHSNNSWGSRTQVGCGPDPDMRRRSPPVTD